MAAATSLPLPAAFLPSLKFDPSSPPATAPTGSGNNNTIALPPPAGPSSSKHKSNANAHATAHGTASQQAAAAAAAAMSSTTFEFTRRKRWADLLIQEVSEAIVLVLSADCRIWFCNRAVSELLGWRDTELIDCDFVAGLVAADGQTRFRDIFEESKRTGEEFMCYSRLTFKGHLSYPHQHRHQSSSSHNAFATSSSLMPLPVATSSAMGSYDGGVGASVTVGMEMPSPPLPVGTDAAQEPLFEIKARPHYILDEREPRCFFAVAKPYPGVSTSQLNSVLDYKIGAQHLEHRLARLKAARPHVQAASTLYSTAGPSSLTGPSALYDAIMPPSAAGAVDSFASQYPLSSSSAAAAAAAVGGAPASTSVATQQTAADGADYGDEARRKKMKKTHAAEQYVCKTCGRTDSPEWRKGPQGPKTLCNACGLRWAKMLRIRQEEEQAASDVAGSGNTGAGSGAGAGSTSAGATGTGG
ncbi:hypothetical protein CONPUDRAFT_141677 [Coniophora puteana RWD-64-598 SS2]|uniref:Uncharacterized protein n=1 Tax=Coniophora puteana (strain RWD-64-598) TaxID=741705 RepID=A0A5M3N089_CONPW|nr:uncharacterized protein CONPUDRAFT_141677 [Coniophora puteana RWD-64-598 SS2]EIW84833.1 hypothetical protein CONPUDRAFT_141677 [Coniophora puteana RWD-64-598 SS2]